MSMSAWIVVIILMQYVRSKRVMRPFNAMIVTAITPLARYRYFTPKAEAASLQVEMAGAVAAVGDRVRLVDIE